MLHAMDWEGGCGTDWRRREEGSEKTPGGHPVLCVPCHRPDYLSYVATRDLCAQESQLPRPAPFSGRRPPGWASRVLLCSLPLRVCLSPGCLARNPQGATLLPGPSGVVKTGTPARAAGANCTALGSQAIWGPQAAPPPCGLILHLCVPS